MKKTLVAVAALATISGAMAEVTITGVMEMHVQQTAGQTTVGGGNNGGSEISFGLVEDLGNGMKAIASTSILNSLGDGTGAFGNAAIGTANTGATGSVSSYNSYIGLSGEFGSVKLGQQFSPTFLTSAIGDVAGRSALSNYLAGGLTGQVANSITYNSPSFSGFSLSYQKALDNTITAAQGQNFSSYSLTYSNGGLTASYAGSKNSTDGTTGALTESVAGVSYDFGVAKVHAGWSAANSAAEAATGYGVSAPIAGLNVFYGYQSQNGANASQYGASYSFSKRTSTYLAQGVGTTNVKTTLVGIRHTF